MVKKLGMYSIGYNKVNITLRDGDGGDFCIHPEKLTEITVSIDYVHFHHVIEVLLHEALEYILFMNNARFTPGHNMAEDTGAFVFIFDHHKFSECCAAAAEFIVHITPTVEKEWKRYHKKKEKK